MYSLQTYRIQLQAREARENLGTACNPKSVVAIAEALFQDLDADREHFVLLCADTKNRIYAYKVLFSGTQDSTMVGIKETLRAALLLGAAAIIIVHNHPSGDPTPSENDKTTTRNVGRGCREIDLRFIDSIILGEENYFSFAEGGKLNSL